MSFEDFVIDFFKKTYNIDLRDFSKEEIKINNLIFPNYITKKVLSFDNQYTEFEYCRIIYKIFGGNYFKDNLSYYENKEFYINNDDIIFDCGANTGIFSLYSSYKGKQVIAFEPSTLIRHYLKITKNYNKDKILIAPFGVSDINKKELFYQLDNPGASRLNEFEVPSFHKILYKEMVNLVSIDDFVQNTKIIPNFIKMDIENGELNALIGAKNTLKTYLPKCSISIHEENMDKINYIKSLFPNNYNFYIKSQEHYDIILLGGVNG